MTQPLPAAGTAQPSLTAELLEASRTAAAAGETALTHDEIAAARHKLERCQLPSAYAHGWAEATLYGHLQSKPGDVDVRAAYALLRVATLMGGDQ